MRSPRSAEGPDVIASGSLGDKLAGFDHQFQRIDLRVHRHDHLFMHAGRFINGVDHLQRLIAIFAPPTVGRDLALDPVGQFVGLASAALDPFEAVARSSP